MKSAGLSPPPGTRWIVPVSGDDRIGAIQIVNDLVCNRSLFAFSKESGIVSINIGDRVCFHATRIGVIADAVVKTKPTHDTATISPFYPWVYYLQDVHCYSEKPIVVDSVLRRKLDAFRGRDTEGIWTWFVQRCHRVTPHDFVLLTCNNPQVEISSQLEDGR